jgi:hypothetical protein
MKSMMPHGITGLERVKGGKQLIMGEGGEKRKEKQIKENSIKKNVRLMQ